MNYQEFKEQFVEDVKRNLYEKGIDDVAIRIDRVDKLNESYDAMSVIQEGSTISMNYHLEDYYEDFENGADYQIIINVVVQNIKEHIDEMPTIDINMITDYEKVKERLSLELVSVERNAEMLKTIPHKQIEDLAIVYKINVDLGLSDKGTVLVTQPLLEQYGISPEQLYADAERNASIIKPVIIRGLGSIMREMIGTELASEMGIEDHGSEEMMYVATVPDRNRGAGVLAYDGFLDYAAQRLGGDFYVLPSSVHEIMLVKDDGGISCRELKEMVEEINEAEVKSEEQLTNSVYHYDSKNRIFEMGEKFEARRDKELAAVREGKGSVLKDLKEKQAVGSEKAIPPKEVSRTRGGEAL